MQDSMINRITGIEVKTVLYALEDAYNPVLSKRIENFDSYVQKLAEGAENFCVYNEEGKPIGFIAFYANNLETRTAYISQLVVKTQNQKSGIGKQLIERCFQEAKAKNMNCIRLEVRNDNVNAQQFYKRMGFIKESSKETSSYMKRDI